MLNLTSVVQNWHVTTTSKKNSNLGVKREQNYDSSQSQIACALARDTTQSLNVSTAFCLHNIKHYRQKTKAMARESLLCTWEIKYGTNFLCLCSFLCMQVGVGLN